MPRLLCISVALGAVAIGCVAARAMDGAAPSGPSFASEVAPIIEANCTGCHLVGDEPGNLALNAGAAYKTLTQQPSTEVPALRLVAAGEPEKSYFLMKIRGTHFDHGGMGSRMPMGGPPLSDADQEKIRAWIAAGAQP